ncbi:MAG: hypothetical protein HYY24_18220 [Verrucomicrobia bacterium]|nr:hypothetical protein [Verrucomicrobiota bacterium]
MTRLGDLHGLPVRELYALRNCGSHTVSELVSLLERVAAGEFQLPSEPFSPAQLGGVLLLLERGLAQLPPRDREMLLLRLGATDNRPWTLEEVGAKFNRTRERVRQVEERMLHAVRRAGGPTLIAQLRGISALCHDLVCPLTPGLLTQWAGPTTGRPQLPPAACLRLLAKLHPDIPAWPEGQQLSSTDQARARAIVSALKDLLHDEGPTLPLKGAWELTRARAGLGDLRVAEFLAALQHGRPAIVQFPRPDQPEVCWPRLWLTNVAKDILASSDRPLTPEEILARAQAAFGSERVHWRPRTLLEKLTPERGFYQLGPRRLGLRRHFKLPEGLWPTVRADVHKLLEQERHPISTAAVVREPSFPWAQQTTAHELANILHEDERFRRVGKRRFALAAWASSNQPT